MEQRTLREKFIGTWKLVSYEYRTLDGEVTYPMGRNMTGLLMYDAHGYMAGQLMNPDRMQFASGDKFRGSPEEVKRAFEGYTAYYGTYEVDEAEGAVNHKVESSMYPNWIGGVQKRFFEFSDNGQRLTLKTPPLRYADQPQTGLLVWEKVG
jgi:hypothetical protein